MKYPDPSVSIHSHDLQCRDTKTQEIITNTFSQSPFGNTTYIYGWLELPWNIICQAPSPCLHLN